MAKVTRKELEEELQYYKLMLRDTVSIYNSRIKELEEERIGVPQQLYDSAIAKSNEYKALLEGYRALCDSKNAYVEKLKEEQQLFNRQLKEYKLIIDQNELSNEGLQPLGSVPIEEESEDLRLECENDLDDLLEEKKYRKGIKHMRNLMNKAR